MDLRSKVYKRKLIVKLMNRLGYLWTGSETNLNRQLGNWLNGQFKLAGLCSFGLWACPSLQDACNNTLRYTQQ